jgi:hypothetical protein
MPKYVDAKTVLIYCPHPVFIYPLLPEANLCVARGASLCYQYRIRMLLEEYPDIAREGSSYAQQTIIIAM